MNVSEMLAAGKATTGQALEIYDALEPVDTSFMIGRWKGGEIITGHPIDGMLEISHWYGKRFDSEEDVHPLVFKKTGGQLTSMNPSFMIPAVGLLGAVSFLRKKWVGDVFQRFLPLFATGKSGARLRMTEFRGKSSATMVYDRLPINDVFRKVDDNTVLGIMDLKGIRKPYFFWLRRDDLS